MYFPFLENGQGVRRYAAGIYQFYDPDLAASNSVYTTLLESIPRLFYDLQDYDKMPTIGDEVDFQVQALIGYVNYPGDGFYDFSGQSGDWSNTQTIKIVETSSTSPNPTPTSMPNYGPTSSPTPSVPEFSWLTILPILLVIPIVLFIIRKTVSRNISL